MEIVNNFLLILFSLYRTISCASVALGINAASISNITLPDICPLGEPLRSSQGSIVMCNCPPHPFCPKLYYCKIAIYGKPGICCADFGADNRHLIKPEDSRLPAIRRFQSSNISCSSPFCQPSSKSTATKSRAKAKNSGVILPPASPPAAARKQQSLRDSLRDPKTICKPVSPIDIPPLPSPKCKYVKVEPDAFGCDLPPRIVCPKSKSCPPFSISVIPPDCVLGREKYDRNGCPVMPDLICGHKLTGKVIQPQSVPQAPSSRPKGTKKGFRRVTVPMRMPSDINQPPMTTQPPSPPPCPVYLLPPTLSPDCVVAPPKKDARGCHLPPEIVCEKRPTSYTESAEKLPDPAPQEQEEMAIPEETKCPKVTTPFVQPGCKLLEPKYNDKGCMLMREIVCDSTIISKKSCPVLTLPKMDPMCTFGPDRNDSNGCPTVPEIICPTILDLEIDTTEPVTETATVMEKKEPRVMSHCPYVPPPYLPAGCTYGVAKYDEKGCSLAPEVICKNQVDEINLMDVPLPPPAVPDDHLQLLTPPRPNFPTTEITPITFKREFKDMLTQQFYHTVNSNVSPDPASFRRSTAIAAVTAGRFYGCRLHADCFHLREPREWCDTGSPESGAQWTEKSCHCSDDTVVPACIVERSNRGFLEWTFCADYSQCALKD